MAASDWAQVAVTGVLGVSAFWVANSLKLRRRTELEVKAIDRRWDAYKLFWSTTKPAAPMRDGPGDDALSGDDRQALHAALASWWFDHGGGMLLGEPTRTIYFLAKHNLACDDDELRPPSLVARVQAAGDSTKARSDLSIRQLSLLRTAMRADLGIIGRPYGTPLEDSDREFLRLAGARLWERPWWTGGWRSWLQARLARTPRDNALITT
jgi:hypothetical protein